MTLLDHHCQNRKAGLLGGEVHPRRDRLFFCPWILGLRPGIKVGGVCFESTIKRCIMKILWRGHLMTWSWLCGEGADKTLVTTAPTVALETKPTNIFKDFASLVMSQIYSQLKGSFQMWCEFKIWMGTSIHGFSFAIWSSFALFFPNLFVCFGHSLENKLWGSIVRFIWWAFDCQMHWFRNCLFLTKNPAAVKFWANSLCDEIFSRLLGQKL